jgi:CO dehydrogenase/acetyl-CoA synthase beta subunit
VEFVTVLLQVLREMVTSTQYPYQIFFCEAVEYLDIYIKIFVGKRAIHYFLNKVAGKNSGN